jgi:hypothetical protein
MFACVLIFRLSHTSQQVMTIAMDNASNCDSTAEEFAVLAPTDWHETWQVRCLLHIINLMAKVRNRWTSQPLSTELNILY